MNPALPPLLDDEYTGAPVQRLLNFIVSKRDAGARGVGLYCGYAPVELIRAMGAVPISLCAFSQKTITAAQEVLPANLCPLIKSSYGFIRTDTCPFFGLSDAVIAETTCDGKKKMFELIADRKPLHVMDLPQLADEPEALDAWTAMVRRLKRFLETTFETAISQEAIEREICETNRRNRLMDRFFSYAEAQPVLLSWSEMYDVIGLALASTATELETLLRRVTAALDERRARGLCPGRPDSPRVLVTGCPLGGDSAKVLRLIEEAGGMVVAHDACSGMKLFQMVIDEGTGDPLRALARAYLTIPCSCMTPNTRRLTALDAYVRRFRPDAVIDVTLVACHSYNIESYTVGRHVKEAHGLPFLQIETDYSGSDVERIRNRVDALLEGCGRPEPRGSFTHPAGVPATGDAQ